MIRPKVIYDYDPRNLPQEAHAAIGLSVACSAQTEHFIEMAIGGALGDAMYMTAVTTHMPMPLRFHVLRAAAEIRIDDLDDLDLLDEILDNIDKAMQKRNDVAHNIWCTHPDTQEIFTVKTTARGSVDTELIPMDIPAIKRDAAAIYAAGIKLLDFMIAKDLFPSLPAAFKSRIHKTKAARKKRRYAMGKK
jgi:hypothetical protein